MKGFKLFLILLLVIGIYTVILLNSRHVSLNSETQGLQANNLPSTETMQETSQEQNQDLISDMFVTRQEFLVSLVQTFGLKPEYGDVNFIDVYSNSLDLMYIFPLYKRGIITGYPDGTLRPYEYITANEAETILARAINKPVPIYGDNVNYLTRKQMYNMLLDLKQGGENN